LVQEDLSDEEDVQEMFASGSTYYSEEGWGEVEIAVINHGVFFPTAVPLKDMPLEQWESTFSNNLTSSFLVAREYLRRLERGVLAPKTTGGPLSRREFGERAAIVFVGSTAGKYGEAMHADYAASKSGAHFFLLLLRPRRSNTPAIMYGLTLSLKNEIVKIAPRARVNCVAPGWVNTPMASEALQDPQTVYRSLATYA
jgi:NAD(P)-dependent dehydrogenase (short-subunit alcohol dehydrogenase family)